MKGCKGSLCRTCAETSAQLERLVTVNIADGMTAGKCLPLQEQMLLLPGVLYRSSSHAVSGSSYSMAASGLDVVCLQSFILDASSLCMQRSNSEDRGRPEAQLAAALAASFPWSHAAARAQRQSAAQRRRGWAGTPRLCPNSQSCRPHQTFSHANCTSVNFAAILL